MLEFDFDFSNTPKHFVDVETGASIDVFPKSIQKNYSKALNKYFKELKLKCDQYKIHYIPVDVREGFNKILMTFFEKRNKFL